jgi:hypothetical protein
MPPKKNVVAKGSANTQKFTSKEKLASMLPKEGNAKRALYSAVAADDSRTTR